MKNILIEIDFIYAFCIKCWNYKKMVFESLVFEITSKIGVAACATCQNKQEFYIQEIKRYYEYLNEDNI